MKYLILLIILCASYNGCSQHRSEVVYGGGFSFADLPKDSLGLFGFTFKMINRIEIVRLSDNFAITGNLGLNYIAGINKIYGYGGQLSIGIDLFRGIEKFPLTINYSYGYNFLNYNQRREGFVADLSSFNFQRLTFSNLTKAPKFGYDYNVDGFGVFIEYSQSKCKSFYSIGVALTSPYGWYRNSTENNKKKKKVGGQWYYY